MDDGGETRGTAARRAAVCWLASVLATAVLFSVFDGWGWFLRAVGAVTLVAVVGMSARAARLPRPLVAVVQVVAGCLYLIASCAPEFSRGGFLPDGNTLAAMRRLADEGFFQIETLTPPVVPSPGMRLIVVAFVLVVALAIDTLAASYRRPALAGLPLLALYAVPTSMVPDGIDAWLFALPAFGFLLLLAADSRDRLLGWGVPIGGRTAPGAGGRGAGQPARMGRNVGLATLSLSLAVPAAVPQVTDGTLGGRGLGESQGRTISTLDPLVSMRRNLLDRTDVELLRVRTSSARPDELYLRAVTLDEFDGVEWKAARREVSKFGGALPGAPGLAPSVASSPVDTQVTAGANFQSDYLPMPYPASRLEIDGRWRLDERTGNVVSYDGREQISGRQYTVASNDLSPTKDDVLPAQSADAEYLRPYLQLPEIPEQVAATARRVARGADGPLEIGIALQQWFRRPGNFVYDLQVTGGTGNSALLDFLRDRRGYCEHFATTMAVMARVLGVPTRMNVGFTAGQLADDGLERVVSSNDAHAWPELWLPGVGWTRFEPTPGSANSTPSAPSWLNDGQRLEDPAPAEEQEAPEAEGRQQPTGGSSSSDSAGGKPFPGEATAPEEPTPSCTEDQTYDEATNRCLDVGVAWWIRWKWQLLVAALGALLASPRALRGGIRRRRWVVARRGDAATAAESAWRELRDDSLDLGYPWPPARTPRQTAVDLRAAGIISPAAAAELTLLADTLERSRYAREQGPVDARRLRTAVLAVRRGHRAGAGRIARLRAAAAPRSLGPWLRGTVGGSPAPGMAGRSVAHAKRVLRTRRFKTT
ncbi:MAG: transglutaminase family protein [Sporichthyaceae bacterium]